MTLDERNRELKALAKKGDQEAKDALLWYKTRPEPIKKLMRAYPPGTYMIDGKEFYLYGYADRGEGIEKVHGAVLLLLKAGIKSVVCTACLIKSEVAKKSWPVDLAYDRSLAPEALEFPDCIKH